jgi:hypothetical protein
MTPNLPIPRVLPRPGEEAARRQVVQATTRLRRYRLVRDGAQLVRLKADPHLFHLIAGILKPQS